MPPNVNYSGLTEKPIDSTEPRPREWRREKKELLSFLQVVDGRDSIGSPSKGTGSWLLCHPTFRNWSNNPTSILWITGKPGAGKSTLMKHIIHQIAERKSDGSSWELTASFFFRSSGNSSQRTSTGLFQSLLYQFWFQMPDSMTDLVNNFREKCWTVGKPGKDWKWNLRELQEHLEAVLLRASRDYKIIIVIDALDECEQDGAHEVVHFFQRSLTKLSTSTVQVCLSSRHNQFSSTKHDLKIHIDDENRGDISQFIKARLQSTQLTASHANSLADQVIENASGVFLWAKLAMNELMNGSGGLRTIRSVLATKPTDLETFYGRILDRISNGNQHQRKLARNLLLWVSYTRRQLSVAELSGALSNHHIELSPQSRFETGSMIMNVTCGLLEVNKSAIGYPTKAVENPGAFVVTLLHQSVKDFLLQHGGLLLLDASPEPLQEAEGQMHYEIVHRCLEYLAMYGSTEDEVTEFQRNADVFPFLQYAAAYWSDHLEASKLTNASKFRFLDLFHRLSNEIVRRWIDLYDGTSMESQAYIRSPSTALHIASDRGLDVLMDTVLEEDVELARKVDLRDAVGRTPLSRAAGQGHEGAVNLLLRRKADLGLRDTVFGQTPLSWAARGGHKEIVKLLLDAGANIEDTTSGTSALSLAAANGQQSVVKLLLERGAAPHSIDVYRGQSALSLAAARGHGRVVSHLLNHGADPNIPDPYSKLTPLHHAIRNGHVAVVDLLVENGASVTHFDVRPSFAGMPQWVDRVLDSLRTTNEKLITSNENGTRTYAHSSCTGSSGCGHLNIKTTIGRKRTQDERNEDDVDDGDSSGRPNKKRSFDPKPDLADKAPSWKLACPYYKFAPSKFSKEKWRKCRDPEGFPDVHRLKDHLHKRHYQPQCLICGKKISDDELAEHEDLRTCERRVRERDYADGFDRRQREKLKDRKVKTKTMSEVDYWKAVYKILFPEVDERLIPSPFHDTDFVEYDNFRANYISGNSDIRTQLGNIIRNPGINTDVSGTVDSILDLFRRSEPAVRQQFLENQRGANLSSEQDRTVSLVSPAVYPTITETQTLGPYQQPLLDDSPFGPIYTDYFQPSQSLLSDSGVDFQSADGISDPSGSHEEDLVGSSLSAWQVQGSAAANIDNYFIFGNPSALSEIQEPQVHDQITIDRTGMDRIDAPTYRPTS